MQITASIVANAIAATLSDSPEFGRRLTISVPEGWDDVKKLCRKVLRHDGRDFTFIGWNSDRNECFFREEKSIAIIKKK